MKRVWIGAIVLALLGGAVLFSGQLTALAPKGTGVFQASMGDTNPWTTTKFNNDPREFRFVVVSDRTGGHREKIFSRAMEQINLLQPEFVISVGDLIEGYSTNEKRIAEQWAEFESFTKRLEMPFFYVPGNHDLTNPFMVEVWKKKFGKSYYHFLYHDVLFLMLNSEDPPGSNSISAEQVEYIRQVYQQYPNPRWTIVALHKPLYAANVENNGWLNVETALGDRPYTVFAGHVHRYQKLVRNGRNHYQLATTGGGSQLRGIPMGEFDHVTQVTMKHSGPVIANLLLDGIVPENLKMPETVEPVGK
ncbi:metallophosphoesterase family protein [Tuwongella immobilis]|uniref:Calcineurin-like phosphoesterase domain-containing protein n=1 Tax=Tuwongella immobilis TaxID=692036 RepID=A0A6C2YQD2_9BACT|nr:metallophosphoesterase [Tuwongella immobilis]VIP03323.1 Probable beta-galactosidase OS=Lentisphaera araneosa HTCC2155 GN=LNTAR_09716 PE=4 SV=1: Metallophos_2 [Tuwongella immobilis]VTS04017.1 Probable beta-galactosidase OS=Lentisphaera araneosa HTCC2155 GN=LNTAR_09716 PE=4 SV=1: Metallophos_2 [Tuwongella immobilis]